MNELPTDNFREVRLSSVFVPPYMGKPKGHNISLFVIKVPGAYLYRRQDRETEQTWIVPTERI